MSSNQTHKETFGTPSDKGDSDAAPCSPPDWDSVNWRMLEKGEIIQENDWVDAAPNGWKDNPVWKPAGCTVGQEAPEPRFPAHRVYRRVIGSKRGCETGTVSFVESAGGEDEMMMGIYPS